MKIRILKSAENDLRRGYRFYESQREGLGSYFLHSLHADIDSLQQLAGVHELHFGKYHCKLAKRFPYAIYYRVSKNIVKVHAVFDCRQDPEKIARRLASH